MAGTLSGRPNAVADNEREKSDLREVAKKLTRWSRPLRSPRSEGVMRTSKTRSGRRARKPCHEPHIREAVTWNKKVRLTALMHHVSIDVLRASFFGLKRPPRPPIDEVIWTDHVNGSRK
jgi:RNA-directed DNA polymerase